ncbi:MAG: phosphohydrolase, partial [Myxococcales bacterium]|nr:phosphohydrolase [Myxococcales bacterium]
DRMDYLQRDAFFSGVSYGQFDQLWLLENLRVHVAGDRALLALTKRAQFAFEDFLLSRYHMFVSVYLHRIPVGYESMLARFYAERPEEFPIPGDPEAYLRVDDVALWVALRASDCPWARRIVQREGFSVALELTTPGESVDLVAAGEALRAEGIEHFVSRTTGMLRKPRGAGDLPIYVVDRGLDRVQPIDESSRIFERYAQPAPLLRVYVPPEQKERARQVLRSVSGLGEGDDTMP